MGKSSLHRSSYYGLAEEKGGESMKKIVFACLAVVALVGGLLIGSLVSVRTQQIEVEHTCHITPMLTITIHRADGSIETITTKDPPTKNFIELMTYIALEHSPSWKDTDGNTHSAMDTEASGSNPTVTVVFSNATSPSYSPDDYNIPDVVADLNPSTSLGNNSTHAWITVSATFTPSEAVNITAVGLKLNNIDYDISDNVNTASAILFEDVLDEQQQLASGDSMGVTYSIYFTNGMTKNFVVLLKNYLFRGDGEDMQSYTDTGGSSRTVDNTYTSSTYFRGRDPTLSVALGTGASQDATTAYKLNNELTSIETDPTLAYNGTTNAEYTVTVSYTSSSDVTITETGFYTKVCWSQSRTDYNLLTDVLTFYDNPSISLSSGQSVTIVYKFTFDFS